MRSARRLFVTLSAVLLVAACAHGGTRAEIHVPVVTTTPVADHAVEPAGTPAGAPRADRDESKEGDWIVSRMKGGAGGGRSAGTRGTSAKDVDEMSVADVVAAPPAPGLPAREVPKTKVASGDGYGGGGLTAGAVTNAPLRAGATDDNVKLDDFLAFMDAQFSQHRVGGFSAQMDVRGRRYVSVVDANGRPIPAAKITISDEKKDALLWTATTYGDGVAPFYPHLAGDASSLRVNVRADGKSATATWDGSQDLTVRLDGERAAVGEVKLDVLFVLDTTGSMGDEIDAIRGSLLQVTDRLKGLGKEFDLRYGAVLYKDRGDEYVTMAHPFSADLAGFARSLSIVTAGGGGDGPESLNEALDVAVNRMDWRDGVAKVAFVITDAPPHMDYGDQPYTKTLEQAVAKGIRIHSVAASGLDADGTVVLRQIAQASRGKFVFIEYGSAAASAASHGVTGEVASNNLDAILYDQVKDEIGNWGHSPKPAALTAKR